MDDQDEWTEEKNRVRLQIIDEVKQVFAHWEKSPSVERDCRNRKKCDEEVRDLCRYLADKP